ncbi:uncharacterized protein LOC124695953 [Lolium rigidum]|uniref:uncharacterized protein LOC124695953 n=1 Tax=Lolium rigidum TaxID=89674 RepID=UPI001F5CAC4E|nr:uncharacterized protein LOC124695953 [Lolium rigidum]
MADIAMLVADEEFEKRLKRGAPGAGVRSDEASMGKANFGAVNKVWGSWVESAAAAASGVKVHVAVLVKADMAEPKAPMAVAAFNGFFSA